MKKNFDVSHLTPLQRKVTLESATERPFVNEYWNYVEKGIYVDIIDGTPLFTSFDKFESDCGWPSFSKPIDNGLINEKIDLSHGMIRKEVRSLESDSHLGHLFNDGPVDKGGMRYCINSASLRLIPYSKLEEEGYGKFIKLFKD